MKDERRVSDALRDRKLQIENCKLVIGTELSGFPGAWRCG
jgi:hypothetical protein